MLYRFCVLRELEETPFLWLLLLKTCRFLLMKPFIVMLLLLIIVCMLMVVVLHRLEVWAWFIVNGLHNLFLLMLSCKASEGVGRVNDLFLDLWNRCLINYDWFLLYVRWLNLSFDLFFIIPDTRQWPDLQALVFGACNQELLIFKPLHLGYGRPGMSWENIHGVAILCRPDRDVTISACRDDFFRRISPGHQAAIGSTLEPSNLLGEALALNPTQLENGQAAIVSTGH